MKAKVKLISAIISLSVACAFAADWPGYLGPKRDSTSTEKGLLRTWPKEGPKALWTAAVGIGYGGPAVSGGKVYLLDRDEQVGDNLRCFDLSSGTELWNFAYDAPGNFDHPGSRTTPTVDSNNVYTCGPLGDLYCISTSTHKPVWNKNIWKDFGGNQLPRWGITQNPLIYRDLPIVAPQTSQAGVVAYDKLTGELKWKSAAMSGNVGYVSPSIVKVGGDDHLVMITACEGRGRSASGGTVNGTLHALNQVLARIDEDTIVVPPHGVVGTRQSVVEFAEMLKTSRKLVRELIADGLTEQQVMFHPSFAALDAQWGNGFIPGPVFRLIVYRDLASSRGGQN